MMKTLSARYEPAADVGVLVDAAWLDAHLHDPAVRVVEVDVSGRAHDEWHIEGAVLWDGYRDLKDADYRLIGTEATMSLLARSGIGPDTTVVFHGYAPALGFWLMKLYGHQSARILDCSRDAWRDEGHPVSSRPSGLAPVGYGLPAPDPRLQAGHATVRNAIGHPGRTLAGGVPGRAVLALRRSRARRASRSRPIRDPPAHRRPVRRARGVPRPRRPARRLLRRRPRRRGRADHVLHDRRPRLRRLVRPDLPARPRERPGLRRFVGRMGPDARCPGR